MQHTVIRSNRVYISCPLIKSFDVMHFRYYRGWKRDTSRNGKDYYLISYKGPSMDK